AQLSKLTHQAALALHKNKVSPFLQSSSKESLKNCVGFLVEEGFLVPQPASPQPSYRLRANPAAQQQQASNQAVGGLNANQLDAQSKTQTISSPTTGISTTVSTVTVPVSLDDYLQFVNALRHRPSSAAQTKDAISIVADVLSKNGKSKM
ncbi:Hypothetical protein, putative, partial [Bodo saltans]